MLLILADSTDPWATLVHREALRTGGDVVWIEPAQLLDRVLLNWPVVTGEAVVAGSLVIDGREILLRDLTGVLSGLPFPLRLNLEDLSASDTEYVTKEATAAWLAFLNAMPCSVVNRPIPGGRSTLLTGSPLLARLAAEHGFLLPASRCTSSQADAVQQFTTWGESAYLKPLGSIEPGLYLNATDGGDQICRVMERQAVSLQRIPEGQQATVYVVGSEIAATVLHSGDDAKRKIDLVSAQAAPCLGLVRALGLSFAECQLVITPEGPSYWLDVSGAPNIWRCPQEVQPQIVRRLLIHLSETRSESTHDSLNGSDGRSSTRERMRPTRSPER
ncbi:MAG: hypothetical protein AAB433_22440 [Nitrospirota bacterium]